MSDPEGDEYYTRKQKKADDTAWLFMKITFYIVLISIVYGLGIWVGNIFA